MQVYDTTPFIAPNLFNSDFDSFQNLDLHQDDFPPTCMGTWSSHIKHDLRTDKAGTRNKLECYSNDSVVWNCGSHNSISILELPFKTKTQSDEHRRVKNRERVRKCRKRKQDRLSNLEDANSKLSRENLRLKLTVVPRKTSSGSITEEHYKAVLQKFFKTVGNDGALEESAASIWSEVDATIYHPNNFNSNGLLEIVEHQKRFHQMFNDVSDMEFTARSTEQSSCVNKVLVNWSFNSTLASSIGHEEVVQHHIGKIWSLIAGASVSIKGTSYVTFVDNKIQEEIRTVDTLHIYSQLQQLVANPVELMTLIC